MAYNPYSSAQGILTQKRAWDTGGDEEKKKAAAAAKKYYDALERNGFGDIAARLRASDTASAEGLVDSLSAYGKTAARPYAKGILTQKYGMSDSEADGLINFNPNTREVSIGSVNIGRPDALVGGTSYYTDPNAISKGIDAWAKATGRYASPETLYNDSMAKGNDANAEMLARAGKLWGMASDDRDTANKNYRRAQNFLYSDFTDTDEYETIMDRYREMGDKAGYGAVASGAGANGGNVDSYAQAQAARQMKSFENAGNAAALDYYRSKMDSLLGLNQAYDQSRRQTVDDLNTILDRYNSAAQNYYGAGQQYFENDQTAKNNEVQREISRANAYGNVPDSAISELYPNPYLNADGSFNPAYENMDFQAEIQRAIERGDNLAVKQLTDARRKKIEYAPDKYGQYAASGATYAGLPTAEASMQADELASNERIAKIQADVDKYAAQLAAEVSRDGYDRDKTIAEIEAEASQYGNDSEIAARLIDYALQAKLANMGYEHENDVINAATSAVQAAEAQGVTLSSDIYEAAGLKAPSSSGGSSGRSSGGSSDEDVEYGTQQQIKLGYTMEDGVPTPTKAAEKFGIDKTGAQLLRALSIIAANGGGYISADEIMDYVEQFKRQLADMGVDNIYNDEQSERVIAYILSEK